MEFNDEFFQNENSERLSFQNNNVGNQFQGQFQNNAGYQPQNNVVYQPQNNVNNQFQVQNSTNFAQGNMMGNYQSNFEKPVKKKKGLKIFLLIVLIFVIFASLSVFAMNAFKSDEDKFLDLLTSKQSIIEVSNQLADRNKNNEQINTTIEINLHDIMEALEGEADEELDTNIKVDIEAVNKADSSFGTLALSIDEEELISTDYAQTGDLIGIKVKDMTEKFIAVENKDLKDLFEKFGAYDTSEIPDKILTEEDYKDVRKMTSADYLRIANKYRKVLKETMDEKIVVDKDSKVTIGDDKITTKKYTLKLTEKDLYNITLSMMETLKDDNKNIEMFLSDMEAVAELMSENGYQDDAEIPTVSEVCEELEELYEELKDVDVEELDDEEILLEISVHEYKGKNVVTEIAIEEDDVYTFKCMNDKNVFLSFKYEDEYFEESLEFVLEGTNSKDKLELKGKMTIKDSYDTIKANLFTMEQTAIKKAKKNVVKLNEENAIILNNASEDELEDLIMEIEEWAENFADDFADGMENSLPLGGSATIKQANYASFAQQFGEFADQVKIDSAMIMAETGKNGKVINNAQKFHMVANGLTDLNEGDKLGAYGYQLPIGYVIPESIQKALYISEDNLTEPKIVAYLITDNKINGYENQTNLEFYGDSNGVEQHFITSAGIVFTIPGFAEEQEDGSIKYYITSQGHYYTVQGKYDGKDMMDELDPILSRDFTKLHGIDMDGNAGSNVGDAKNKHSMYKVGSFDTPAFMPLEKTDAKLNN